MAVTCDITKMEDIKSSVQAIRDAHGKIDIAVNATGVGLPRAVRGTSEADLNMMMDLQFKGPYQFMQVLVGVMPDPSSIIQISSATATILVGNHHAYIGTKAGIDHVVRGVADEYGAKGDSREFHLSRPHGLTNGRPSPRDAGAHRGLLEKLSPRQASIRPKILRQPRSF